MRTSSFFRPVAGFGFLACVVLSMASAAWHLERPRYVAGFLDGAAYAYDCYWVSKVDGPEILHTRDLHSWSAEHPMELSNDGTVWRPVSGRLKEVGGRLFLLSANELVFSRSVDGEWRQLNVGSDVYSGQYSINDIAFGDGKWMAVGGKTLLQGGDSTLLTSDDGEHWRMERSTFPLRLMWIEWVDGEFVIGGGHFETGGWIFRTKDGQSWTETIVSSLPVTSVARSDVGWVATTGTIDGMFGSVLFSPDGMAWTTVTPDSNSSIGVPYHRLDRVIAWNGGFVVAGVQVILRSEDGANWREVVRLPDESMEFHEIVKSPDGLVAVGSQGLIYTSSDGIDWRDENGVFARPDDGRTLDLARGGFRFNLGQLEYSLDGKNWMNVATTGAAVGGGQIVSAGDRLFTLFGFGGIAESRDGRAWREVLAGGLHVSTLDAIAWWRGELWGIGDRHRVVHGTPETGFTVTGGTSADEPDGYFELAVGEEALLARGYRNALLIRADGTRVESKLNLTTSHFINGVAYGAGRFVLSWMGVGQTYRCRISTDGVNWSEDVATPAPLGSLRYADGIYRAIALGGTSVYRSFDGLHWSLEADLGVSSLQLDYQAGRWLAADPFTTVFGYEPDPAGVGPGLRNFSGLTTLSAGRIAIGGFVVAGTEPQDVLVRVVGPDLARFGVANPLADPRHALFDRSGQRIVKAFTPVIFDGPQPDPRAEIEGAAAAVGAFPLQTWTAGVEAEIYRLSPGAYTVHASSASGGAGQVLLEVYALNPDSSALCNVSWRLWAESAETPAIVGVVTPQGAKNAYFLRGVGPGLRPLGVPRAADGAAFSGFGADGGRLFASDALAPLIPAEVVERQAQRVGAFALPSSPDEPTVLTELPAGVSTFHLKGKTTAGEVLFELYQLP